MLFSTAAELIVWVTDVWLDGCLSSKFFSNRYSFYSFCPILTKVGSHDNNNNNNNQYIYKQCQSHAMSQRRWLATAVIFRPSDVSLGFAET